MNYITTQKRETHVFFLQRKPILTNNAGQSLIEFILTLTFSLGIVFFFFSIAFNSTEGYLVHYATYMASRTYAVLDVNANQPNGSDVIARNEAERVFKKYIKNPKGKFTVNDPESTIGLPYVGTSFEFKQKFSIGLIGSKDEMNLTSESFLGKEPTRATCAERICYSFLGIGGGCERLVHYTLYDNGC